MQNSTALVKSLVPPEHWGREPEGSFAALQFVSRRRDLGIVDPIETSCDVAGEGVIRDPGDGGQLVGDASSSAASNEPECLSEGGSEEIAEGAGLVHDAGNLLGALSLYAELLAAPGVLHDEYREYAEDLRLLSERSSAMMARLLSQAQKRPEPVEPLTVIPDVIARCRGLLTRIAGRKVEVQLGSGSHKPVGVSCEIVERILTNLVKNAGEAMPRDLGTIVIRVEERRESSESTVIMTVYDTGRGMTRAQIGSLGERGHRGTNGRGLGFRVVRELAAMSGGSLGIASTPGEGTAVSVEWSVVEQVEVEVQGTSRRVTRGAAGWIAC